ncbi:segregation and condensation protein A [Natronincola ferrireducens]|uniref:Segregation and condensation protein A n=1 Tax=Natronincola ferrireducens TaxID=393762 RepID=A0A1G9CE52_9FIRM|nr:segregation/condensation protein A [Natronincola ferrireducens]SDK49930.1 condensin subunit ScpA [Natronincola ferrireducens]
MGYTIKIEAFEGPFDLLFHLIEKNKIDLYDIPVNEITEQYLYYLYEMEKLDLDIASEFLVMAATLIEIKSKILLPNEVLEDEEVEEDIDPRSQLVKRLLEYKKYKAVAEELRKREVYYNKLFFKQREEILIESSKYDTVFENLEVKDLINVFNKMLFNKSNQRNEALSHIRQINREPVTIEDKLNSIMKKLEIDKRICFTSIFTSLTDKIEIVVTFLALLELMKMKKVKVIQEKCFDGITIEGIN